MTDVTIGAVICALNEVILTSSDNCKVLKDTGGMLFTGYNTYN